MSTLTATKPAQHARHARHARPDSTPEKKTTPPLWARYIGAMLYFMGAALIAGGVVHYPIDPPQYAIITVIGALVFALGTVFNEFVLAPERPTLTRAAWAVTTSLFLSFGVGLAGGGIQHFDQFPERCAVMTPLGLALSYIAYVAKDTQGRWRDLASPFAAGVATVVIAVWLGMTALAATIDSGAGHTHGDSGHSSPTDTAGAVDGGADQRNPAPSAPAKPAEQPSDDGHDHGH